MALPLTELLCSVYEHDGDAGDSSARPPRANRARPSAPTVDDAGLVERLRAGDGTAHEAAIEAYHGWLFSVALSYVHSELIAEEILDEAFARVWERREALAPDTRLSVYLFVSVRNAALNRLKHETTVRRRLDLASATELPGHGTVPLQPDAATELDDVQAAVRRAIARLPERAQAIMVLRWREQLDWPEIAAALDMSIAAVQKQHARALQLLRRRLARYVAGE